MAYDSFVFDNFLDDWLNVSESWCMIQVNRLDTCNPFSVIKHLMLLVIVVAWLHQGVKHDVAIEVDDWNSRQSLTFVRQDPFTVQCKHLGLFSSFVALIEHIVKHHWLVWNRGIHLEALNQVLLGKPSLWSLLLAFQGATSAIDLRSLLFHVS